MKNVPRISIVIPTRNRADRLAKLIATLNSQGGEWDEAIVVDDGGDDSASEGLAALCSDRIRLLRQPHLGPAAARNAGWQQASGNVILFIDDDVCPLSGAIGQHADYHGRFENAEEVRIGRLGYADFPAPNPFMLYLTESPYGPFNPHRPSPPGQEYRLLTTSAVSLKRRLLEEVGGFDEKFANAWAEDFEFGRRLMQAGARFSADKDASFLHHKRYELEPYCRKLRERAADSALMERKANPAWRPPWKECDFDSDLFSAMLQMAEETEARLARCGERTFGRIGLRNSLWELYRALTAMAHNQGLNETASD